MTGNQVPLMTASSETIPPVAGPTLSTVSTWPRATPSAPNGSSAISDQERHLDPRAHWQLDAEDETADA